jgi:small subunit ribosomal protein S1
MNMGDLLAQQDKKILALSRGQEVEGEVIAILTQEIILDLGTKAEGSLSKKDLSPEQIANLKVGDKILTFVLQTENESGQAVLGLQKAIASGKGSNQARWQKYEQAKKNNQTLTGKGLEVNKGGLIVEIEGIRGFLPSSQVLLSQAGNIDDLVGKNITVTVLEVDPSQNKLIFSQKANLSQDQKTKLSQLKVGDKVKGKVAAVLQFGIFVSLENGLEGLVHVSEASWERMEDPNSLFKVGDEVEAKVITIDANTGRANLSIKQLTEDPFSKIAKTFQPDDVVKGKITKVTPQGVVLELKDGVEGFIPQNKLDADTTYEEGKEITCLVDSADNYKRRINLVPFVTSTKDLIYK